MGEIGLTPDSGHQRVRPVHLNAVYGTTHCAWASIQQHATEQRPLRETVMQWLAALSFALTNAFAYQWLREWW
jgi:hypothetical protein